MLLTRTGVTPRVEICSWPTDSEVVEGRRHARPVDQSVAEPQDAEPIAATTFTRKS